MGIHQSRGVRVWSCLLLVYQGKFPHSWTVANGHTAADTWCSLPDWSLQFREAATLRLPIPTFRASGFPPRLPPPRPNSDSHTVGLHGTAHDELCLELIFVEVAMTHHTRHQK